MDASPAEDTAFYAIYVAGGVAQSELSLKTISEKIPSYEDGGVFAKNLKTIVHSKLLSDGFVPDYTLQFKGIMSDNLTSSDRVSEWGILLVTFPLQKRNSNTPEDASSCSRSLIVVVMLCPEFDVFESYHDELERFCKELRDYVPHTVDMNDYVELELCLSQWFQKAVLYVRNSIKTLGSSALSQFLHACLSGAKISCKTTGEQTSEAITRLSELKLFAELCSVESVARPFCMGQAATALDKSPSLPNTPLNTSSPSFELWLSSDGSLESVKYDAHRNMYSDKWAEVLLRTADQCLVSVAKHLITTFKSKAIQDFKYLQRLLLIAETDHYALFSSLEYLRKTQNSDALLCLLSIVSICNTVQLNVIRCLENYIRTNAQ